MKLKIAVILLCIISCLYSRAQDYVISFKHWGVKEGLPHRQINCIHQDRRGLIWIGTPYGLTRFDGYNFTTYLMPNDGSPYNDIYSIAEDASGNLWVSNRGVGKTPNRYMVFNPATDEIIPIEKLTGKNPGFKHGYFSTLFDSSILLSDYLQKNLFYTWHPAIGWDTVILPAGYAFQFAFEEKKLLVTVSNKNELVEFDLHGKPLKKTPLPFSASSLFWFLRVPGNNQYVADKTTNRMYTISPELEVKDVTNQLPAPDNIGKDDIFNVGRNGIIWRQGKLFDDNKKILRDFVKDGLIEFGNQPRAIITDNRGRSWQGNDFGLYQLSVNKNKFHQYFKDSANNFNYNSCRGLFVTGDSIYVNTQINGLYLINKSSQKRTSLVNLAPKYKSSYAITKTKKGAIITYTKESVFEIRNGEKTKSYPLCEDHRNHTWTFYECDTNKFLLGCESGLGWFDFNTNTKDSFRQYNQFPELASHTIIYIAPGNDGKLLLCSSDGLYEYNTANGITARYSSADTGNFYLPATDFHHFFRDTDGIYWLSTTQGLIRWDRVHNAYQQFSRANGLSNNNVYAAYPDDYGNIWLSSDYGIMKFNKATGVVKTYLTEDGITYNEFNRISHFKDDSGIIYFGSLNGITAFHPRSFAESTADDKRQSPLIITSFQQFNGRTNKLENRKPFLLKTNTIILKPQDRFFTLEFALINYSDPELTTYYWKIEGIDSVWNVQKDRTIRLSRLPYGEKVLRIKAQESDGTWSANELVIQLSVVKPFYLNNWFIGLCIAVVIAVIVLIYRWRLRFLQKENARLEATVTERTKDLQQSLQQKDILLGEIHHRVKNNLQMICSLLELQSYKIVDDDAKVAFEESQNRVMSIAIIHEKLYQNELFNSLDFHAFITDLFEQIKKISGDRLQHIELTNEFPEKYYDIDIAVPLGLILNELITNSIKHAEPQKPKLTISITFSKEGAFSVITYSDNGPGLPQGFDWKNSKSLGMQLVHMQSQQLGGHAEYHYNNGSVFSIYFLGN